MSTAERLAIALEALLSACPDANDGRLGMSHRVTHEAIDACRAARKELAAYRSTPADGGGQGVTPLSKEQIEAGHSEWVTEDDRTSSPDPFTAGVRFAERHYRIGTPASTGPTVDDVWDRHTLLGPPDE